MSRRHPFRFLAPLMLLAALGTGCRSGGARDDGSDDKSARPAPERASPDSTEACVRTCGDSRRSCQIQCDDPECNRACVPAYEKCLDVCGGVKK